VSFPSNAPHALADEISVNHCVSGLQEDRADIAVRAHCLRVATWSSELAGAVGLSESERKLVEQAAISHHIPEILVDDQAHARLLAEMRLEAAGDRPLVPHDVRTVLETLWGRRPVSDPAMGKIVAVLEISDDFDQYFESEPFFDDADSPDECANSSVEAMLSCLRITSRAEVTRIIDRLPGLSRAARHVVRRMRTPDGGPPELDEVATALRGNFASPQSHHIWNHSLEVAQTARMLARHCSTKVQSFQALLAGLIHDIGRLAFSSMSAAFIERFHRLTDGGCPPVEVEICLAGRCHGEVGSEILAQWKFPAEIVEAVRWHHHPERSPLALTALLYLAEFVTESREDLPSYIRLDTACRQAGISVADLAALRHQDSGELESLRFPAYLNP
jgi:putative nucleotidyltransferase with HDIG domain